MLCCGLCGNMSKRDYKVATTDGIELEPLGSDKENLTNGCKNGGDSSGGVGRQARNGVAVCSQKRALCVAGCVLGVLLLTALIIAYAGPQNECGCAGKMPPGYLPDDYNASVPFNPIATNGEPFPWHKLQLPDSIRPVRYTLTIHPNMTSIDVKGQVTIEFHVEKETNFIVLHIQELNITEKAIFGPKGFVQKIVRVLEYTERQQLYIELKDRLRRKSNYTLSMRWYARLETEPEGFYVDQYDGIDGRKRYLAATVFRQGFARRAFPCFDEPHLRAPFRISVFRDRFHIGLSNSIVHATDDVGFYMGTGLLRDDFIETPPLPPDAIAWVVSDFQRESLDASSAYQFATTALPLLHPRRTAAPLTDSFSFRKFGVAATTVTTTTTTTSTTTTTTKPPSTTTTASRAQSNQTKIIASQKGADSAAAKLVKRSGLATITTAPSYTIYAPPAVLQRAGFVLHTCRDVLEYLQTWLGVAYPLPKLDFVALPSLTGDEAISSLGLITLQTAFLQDPDTITTHQFHQSAIALTEAIVQQFLGGITSPKLWRHAWLWDGLCKYLGRLVLIPLQPLWPMDEMHLMHISTRALDVDVLQGWPSIQLGGSADDGHLDTFYVDKSAAILAMLHSAIGDRAFRECVGQFISAFRFQTSEPADLWAICTKRTNNTRNVKEWMNLWTGMEGFPLLTVKRLAGTVTVSQQPFRPAAFHAIVDEPLLLSPTTTAATLLSSFDNVTTTSTTTTTTTTTTPAPRKSKSKSKFVFPVSYVSDVANVSDVLWFHNADITFHVPADIKWIKMNAGQMGYYRVLYDEDNWNSIISQLKQDHGMFTPLDRIGLISDAFTLCHANLMPCPITLDLIRYLPHELNWGPLTTALQHLEHWRRVLKYAECFHMLSEFIKALLAKPAAIVGWSNGGAEPVRLLRPEVLLASVLWEEPDAIRQARQLLHEAIGNGTLVPANLREVAYTGAVLAGELTHWQYCWDRYVSLRGTTDALTERLQLLRALGKTKDAWLQNRLLAHVVTLPQTEVVQVLESIAGTPTGGAMACRFLQAKWFDLQARMGRGSVFFAQVVAAITQYGATKFDYDELKSLVHRFGDGPGMPTLNMTLKSVAANVEWVSRSQKAIFHWVETVDGIR